MQELNFSKNNNKDWVRYKDFYKNKFWDDLNQRIKKDIAMLLQDQIYEEFDMQIGVSKYERSKERIDYRNGTRTRSFESMYGYIEDIIIPRARSLDIRFSAFELWERVQPKVVAAMTTAYLLGKSASCAQDIIEAFGQSRFSRSFLQKQVKKFEKELSMFHQRKIGNHWKYIFIDGMHVKIRDDAYKLKNKVVLFALGRNGQNKTSLLDWIVIDQEDEISVRSLLISLKNRGLISPDLFISDDSKGIISALKLEYPYVKHQLCVFHKIKNIGDNITHLANRKEILNDASQLYKTTLNKKTAFSNLKRFQQKWSSKEPEAIRLFTKGFERTLAYLNYPKKHWKCIYTNNPVESFIGKVRSWTNKFNYFQGKANLELALFTYIKYKYLKREVAVSSVPIFQKYTLLVA